MNKKPLHVGDKVKLKSPGYGEPRGECVVLANRKGNLVWFSSAAGGACFVARRPALLVVRRGHEDT